MPFCDGEALFFCGEIGFCAGFVSSFRSLWSSFFPCCVGKVFDFSGDNGGDFSVDFLGFSGVIPCFSVIFRFFSGVGFFESGKDLRLSGNVFEFSDVVTAFFGVVSSCFLDGEVSVFSGIVVSCFLGGVFWGGGVFSMKAGDGISLHDLFRSKRGRMGEGESFTGEYGFSVGRVEEVVGGCSV